MTTEYEEYQELVTKYRELRTVCDRCGVVIPEPDTYDTLDFDLRCVKGHSYSNDSGGSGWCVEDLCDDCVEILKTLLKQYSFKLSIIEY